MYVRAWPSYPERGLPTAPRSALYITLCFPTSVVICIYSIPTKCTARNSTSNDFICLQNLLDIILRQVKPRIFHLEVAMNLLAYCLLCFFTTTTVTHPASNETFAHTCSKSQALCSLLGPALHCSSDETCLGHSQCCKNEHVVLIPVSGATAPSCCPPTLLPWRLLLPYEQ